MRQVLCPHAPTHVILATDGAAADAAGVRERQPNPVKPGRTVTLLTRRLAQCSSRRRSGCRGRTHRRRKLWPPSCSRTIRTPSSTGRRKARESPGRELCSRCTCRVGRAKNTLMGGSLSVPKGRTDNRVSTQSRHVHPTFVCVGICLCWHLLFCCWRCYFERA